MDLEERMGVERELDPDKLKAAALKYFHRLWGKGQEKADYDKGEWVCLQLALNKLGVEV